MLMHDSYATKLIFATNIVNLFCVIIIGKGEFSRKKINIKAAVLNRKLLFTSFEVQKLVFFKLLISMNVYGFIGGYK